MDLAPRLFGPLLSSAECESVFADSNEAKRMELVREKIHSIRSRWGNEGYYKELTSKLEKHIQVENQPVTIRAHVVRLLEGFNDYADAGVLRSMKTSGERYAALELYCTKDGYDYIYSVTSKVLRTKDVDEELLTIAVTLVEFLTIDLYNLRLSNLGDARYENFEGITYRGLCVTQKALEDYRKVANLVIPARRNFSIPLGLMSSTTDAEIMERFGKTTDPKLHQMHWEIHVYGIDEGLLQGYLEKYPNSIVTSICALPVARLSPFGEKEILLRGAFFQMINMKKQVINGRDVHKLILVMINANRDHVTELGSNIGDKKMQRDCFRRAVIASKYRACSSVAALYSVEDAEKYKQLYHDKLEEIRHTDGIDVVPDLGLTRTTCGQPATWLGGSLFSSYPSAYASLRRNWQDAIIRGRWRDVEKILKNEYDWCQSDWFNIAKLSDDGEVVCRSGYTVLHELAVQGLEANIEKEDFDARNRIIALALKAPGIWKTIRTFDSDAKTAQQLRVERGEDDIFNQLKPQIRNKVPSKIIEQLEGKLHRIMRDKASEFIDLHAFRMPQLSVLTELEYPAMWIPIPEMRGGFAIHLQNWILHLRIFETIVGHSRPRTTYITLAAEPSSIAYLIEYH